jgi:hypothetical protein
MEARNTVTKFGAARAIASIVGVLAGLGGMTHGVGEILQGNVAPESIFINSWATGPIATSLGGEPAMTIVPSMMATGILNIILTLILIVWAAAFVQKKQGGAVLALLSVLMLLVGGGFAPPLIGILAGIAGTQINSPHHWWRKHVPAIVLGTLAGLWLPVFGVTVINGVFLVIGSVTLVYFLGLNNPDLFIYSFFLAIVTVILSILTGIAYDIRADMGTRA